MRFEFTAIRPGSLTDDGKDSTVKYDEDRIVLLRVIAIEKVKGTYSKLKQDISYKRCFSEIKSLILKMRILGETIRDAGKNTGCPIKDLGALDCRTGCPICKLERKSEELFDGFPGVREGPG